MTDHNLPQIILAPEAFTPRVEVLEMPALGQKVSDLVSAAMLQGKMKADADTLRRLRVHVDGVPMPCDTREERLAAMRYVPQAGEIINLVVVVHGGGGDGGDKVLQVVLTLAVVALSIWTGGAAGPLAAAAPWVRAAASAGVMVGGQMAISAMFAPDNDKLKDASAPGSLQDGSNSYRPRSPMPLCLGFRRWAFDLAAPPYTTLIGNTTYLNVAVAPHYGRCWVGNMKIGETLIADYPAGEIQIESFLTPGVPRRSKLYPNRVVQENYQDELEKGGPFEVHTSADSAEQIEVDLTLPNGLRWNKSSGKIVPQEVQGLIEYQLVGSPGWTPAPIPPARDKNGTLLPAGNFYIEGKTKDPIRRTLGFDTPAKGQYNVRARVWNPDAGEPADELTDKTFWTALRTIEERLPILDETLSVIFIRVKSTDDLNGNLPLITGECEPIVPVYQGGNWNTQARTSNGAALLRWLLTGPTAAKPMALAEFHSSCEATYELIEANPTWKGSLLVTEEKSQQDVMIGLGKMGRFSTFWNGSKLCFVPDWSRGAPRQVFSGRNAAGYRYRRTFPEPIHAVFVEFLNLTDGSVDDELFVYADGYDATNATLIESLRLDFGCSAQRAFQEGRVYLAKRLLQVEVHEWSAGSEAIATTYGDRVLVRHPATLFGLADGRVVNRFFSGALVSGFRLDEEVEMVAGKTYGVDIRRSNAVIRGVPVVTVPGKTNVLQFAAPRAAGISPGKGDLVVFGETGVISEDVEIIDVEPQDDLTVTFRAIPYIADAIAGAINNPIPPIVSTIVPRLPPPKPQIIRPDFIDPAVGGALRVSVGPWTGTPISSFAARWRQTVVDTVEGTSVSEWTSLRPIPVANGIIRTGPIQGAAHPPADGQAVMVDIEVRTVLVNAERSEITLLTAIPVLANIATPANFAALGVTRTATNGTGFGAIQVSASPISTGDIQNLEVEVQPRDGGPWVTPTGGLVPARVAFTDVLGLNEDFPGYNVRGRWIRSDNWPGPWVTLEEIVIPAGSNVSSDTINVGGYPASDLLTDLASASAMAATALASVEIIEGDYQTIIDAKDAAVTAAGSATGSAAAASTSATLASTMAGEAGDSALAAQASQVAASNSAGSASSAAATAVTQAAAAEGFATSSAASATSASTAAGQALTYRNEASTSAADAVAASITAGTAATTAGTARDEAEDARDLASSAAATAVTQASNASASAASASINASLAASVGTGAGVMRDPTMNAWPVGNPLPDNFGAPFGDLTVSRQTTDLIYGDKAMRLVDTAVGNGYIPILSAGMAPASGETYWVVDYQLTLNSGDLRRFGVQFRANRTTGYFGANVDLAANHPTTTPGVTYRGSKLFQVAPLAGGSGAPTTCSAWFYTNLSSFSGGAYSAKDLTLHMLQFRPATPEEVAAGVSLPTIEANLTVTMATTADLGTRMSTARFEVIAAAGGNPAKLLVRADATGSLAELVAQTISFSNVVGGTIIQAMKLVSGEVFFMRPIYIDVGTKRLLVGPAATWVMWFGPNTFTATTATRTNGHWSFGTDGKVYYGSTELNTDGGFRAQANLGLAFGTRTSAGAATTALITITTSGATGTVTYTWSQIGGEETWTIISPTGASTAFRVNVATPGEQKRATFVCRVADSGTGTSYNITVGGAVVYNV